MAWHQTWNDPPQGHGGGFFRPRMPWKLSGVTMLVIVTVGIHILDWLTGRQIFFRLGALTVEDAVFRLQVWRLVTYMFLHGGLFHILINMFILWMLGRYLEAGLGRKQFFYLYFISGIVGGLFQIGFDVLMDARFGVRMTPYGEHNYLTQPAVGASGAVMGVLMAFGTLYPRERVFVLVLFFFVPIEARWLALGYFVLETLSAIQGLSSGVATGVAHAAHVGGLVVGYIWIRFGRLIYGRLQGLKDRAVASGGGERRPRREEAERAEVDRILRKIHEQGIASLTTREKLFLQDTSRRYRDGS